METGANLLAYRLTGDAESNSVPADNRFGQLAFQSPEETLFADLTLEHSEHYAPFTLSYARCARTHSDPVGGARGSRRARLGGESRKIRLTPVKRLHEMCGAFSR